MHGPRIDGPTCPYTMLINMSARKHKLELNSKETERFIYHYLSHEMLWNVTHVDYSRRHKRNAALISIKQAFPEKNMTTEQISSKIANLRTTFARELRKEINSVRNGSGENEIYKSSWEHFSTLERLRPHVKHRNTKHNIDSMDIGDNETDRKKVRGRNHDETPGCTMSDSITMPITTMTQNSPTNIMQSDFCAAIDPTLSKINQFEDTPNSEFVRYLAQEMKVITDTRLLRSLKSEMQTLIFEFQEKQEQIHEQYICSQD